MVLVKLCVVDLPLSVDEVPPGSSEGGSSESGEEDIDFDLATIVNKNNYVGKN